MVLKLVMKRVMKMWWTGNENGDESDNGDETGDESGNGDATGDDLVMNDAGGGL
jgi:hypothetical protein